MKQEAAPVRTSTTAARPSTAMVKRGPSAAMFIAALLWLSVPVLGQATIFTYQGRLQDGGTAANGSYDFQFTLWDALNGGTQQPQPGPVTVTRPSVQVANGVFTVSLDFGASAFPGADRYLEISVRLAGAGAFTILSPRQPITSTPYAIRATNTTQLGGVAASQYVLTNDSRLTDARTPVAGSTNYIQNTAITQAGSNFNISGDGTAGGTLTANIVNATTQYNIGGSRVLSTTETNLYIDTEAGNNNTNFRNSFFGRLAGSNNNTGSDNSFFGHTAGNRNTSGDHNSFFGRLAGFYNTTGSSNSIFGESAGLSNTAESYNTFLGADSDGAAGITNSTAIGYRAQVTQSNSLVLGSMNGVNNATANTNVGIGTTAPLNRLQVVASLNAVATPTGHVTLIENTSTGTSPDVLALKIGRTTSPESSNNFITFFKGDDASVGSIEGNGSGGVVLAGPGADYAEWLPRLDAKESIQPGDLVGVFDGRISKATHRASQVMVISSGAIVAGNDPGTNQRATHSLVAFIGQASVRVRGAVQAGDLIVPSGQADGIGLAVSPEKITAEQLAQVVGQAWETSASAGVKLVRVAVGLMRHDPTLERLLTYSRQQATQIAAMEARLEELQRQMEQNAELQQRNTALDARLTALEQMVQQLKEQAEKPPPKQQ